MEWDDHIIDDALRRSVSLHENDCHKELPDPEGIWTAIDLKRRRGKMMKMRRTLTIAASLIVMISTAAVWYFSQRSTTLPLVNDTHQPVQTIESDALAYIKNLCEGNNIVCSSPAFAELQTELNTSSAELSTVNQQIKLYGQDELLLRAKTRIENHQARIIKAMVQLL